MNSDINLVMKISITDSVTIQDTNTIVKFTDEFVDDFHALIIY